MNDYFLSVQLHYFGFNFADIISYEFFDVPKRLKQAVMTNEAGYLFLLL